MLNKYIEEQNYRLYGATFYLVLLQDKEIKIFDKNESIKYDILSVVLKEAVDKLICYAINAYVFDVYGIDLAVIAIEDICLLPKRVRQNIKHDIDSFFNTYSNKMLDNLRKYLLCNAT